MAQQQKQSRRDPDDETVRQRELAELLQERIKPGLNRGAIPLLARSIAKEIVHREHLDSGSDDAGDDEQPAEADDEPTATAGDDSETVDDTEAAEDGYDDEDDTEADDAEDEYDDEDDAEAEADDDYEDETDDDDAEADAERGDEDDEPLDFEDEMHELQAELGDDWILRFSVQGDDAWLTADKKDGSQHVEAPTAEVLIEAVELLEEGGEQSS